MWIQAGEIQALDERITSCKECVKQLLSDKKFPNEGDVQRAHAFIHILLVFEAEISCARKEWASLLRTVEVGQTWYTIFDKILYPFVGRSPIGSLGFEYSRSNCGPGGWFPFLPQIPIPL